MCNGKDRIFEAAREDAESPGVGGAGRHRKDRGGGGDGGGRGAGRCRKGRSAAAGEGGRTGGPERRSVGRRLVQGLGAALLALFLGGCWDKVELEDIAFVTAIGFDRGERPGLLDVTLQIVNTQKATITLGTAAEGEPRMTNITLKNTTPLMTKDLANAVITRRINISQTQAFLISEDLARNVDLYSVLAMTIRDPEMRRETPVIITRERAEDFIRKNVPRFETLIYEFYRYKLNRWKDTGIVPLSSMNDYLRAHAAGQPYLFVYASARRTLPGEKGRMDDTTAGKAEIEGGDPVEMIGSAIVYRGKMIGALTGEETRLALLLAHKLRVASYYMSFRDPVKPIFQVSTRIKNETPPLIRIDLSRDPMVITVDVPFYVEVLSIPSKVDYVTDRSLQKKLIQSILEQMDEKTARLLHKAQKEWRVDLFDWARYARQKFWTWDAWERFDFADRFPDARVRVRYRIEMIDFGKQFNPDERSRPLEDLLGRRTIRPPG
ncbi:MAG: Spore germination protein GerKC [Hydrogenibacillus schlegelii]|uniref:Spore germination protein GerKC n=1 Tax=Hydrogenibacillus schlegelii TaxID=1484 RepID=A0A2T5GF32_HYDSH|nr:Ger(x)C family spore germination C-terminal domain-containing protein [Hydrogenibacillus schlegelii]PTQ54802.1 MAG: Spore germination protein GerKC [Hydrogenibacillus schlegelii]